MLYTPYNIPEGFGYDFEIENSKTYDQRIDELKRAIETTEIVHAKVIGYEDDGKILSVDFGAGIKGLCINNWISDDASYWLNKYLVGKVVNVKVRRYNEDDEYPFVCSRRLSQMHAYEIQKERYEKGTKVFAKIIYHNDKIVIVDIGGGNITYTYANVFRNFDFSSEYVNIEITNECPKRSNFWFTLDNNLRRGQVISKVADGYLVAFEDNPDKHTVMKTDEELKIGQSVFMEKNVVVTTTYKFYSAANN